MGDSAKILVMASGNGSNFQVNIKLNLMCQVERIYSSLTLLKALIDAVKSNDIPNSRIIRLFVNRGKAYATTRADNAGRSIWRVI